MGRPDLAAPYVSNGLESHTFTLNAVAQKRGLIVFVCSPLQDGTIPNASMRYRLQHKATKSAHENILVFTDASNTRQVWQWLRRGADVPVHVCEHPFVLADDSKALAQRLLHIAIGIEEETGQITLAEVLSRAFAAFYIHRTHKNRAYFHRMRLADCDFARFDDGLRDWLEYVYSVPRLGRREEYSLIRAAKSGNFAAKHRFLEANLYLVAETAWKMTQGGQHHGELLSDLIQEGYFGLVGSMENFDPNLGYRFQSYAPLRILRHIERAVNELSKTISLPDYLDYWLTKVAPRYAVETDRLWQFLGREPTINEIGSRLGLTPKEQIRLHLLTDQVQSLYTPELAPRLQKIIDRDITHCPLMSLVKHDTSETLRRALKTLNPQEQELLIARYGLNGEEPQTLDELSRVMKRSRERLRQMESQALQKLRRQSQLQELASGIKPSLTSAYCAF